MRDEKKEAAQKERKNEGNGKVDVTLDYQSYNPLVGLRYGVCLYVREAREAGWFSSTMDEPGGNGTLRALIADIGTALALVDTVVRRAALRREPVRLFHGRAAGG